MTPARRSRATPLRDQGRHRQGRDRCRGGKVIVDRVNNEYGVKFATSKVELNGAKAPNGNRDVETNNGDLITDAMRWKVLQNKDGLTVNEDHVVAITNGGGIRAAIAKGDVTKKDINTVLPFGNTVAVVYVTGEQLLEALERLPSAPRRRSRFPAGFRHQLHHPHRQGV